MLWDAVYKDIIPNWDVQIAEGSCLWISSHIIATDLYIYFSFFIIINKHLNSYMRVFVCHESQHMGNLNKSCNFYCMTNGSIPIYHRNMGAKIKGFKDVQVRGKGVQQKH